MTTLPKRLVFAFDNYTTASVARHIRLDDAQRRRRDERRRLLCPTPRPSPHGHRMIGSTQPIPCRSMRPMLCGPLRMDRRWGRSDVWLGREDSNLRMPESKSRAPPWFFKPHSELSSFVLALRTLKNIGRSECASNLSLGRHGPAWCRSHLQRCKTVSSAEGTIEVVNTTHSELAGLSSVLLSVPNAPSKPLYALLSDPFLLRCASL
jgi:hypothetical protein